MSDFVCVGYVYSECGAVSLAPVQLTGVRVGVLVWRVTQGGVENRLDIYALSVGNNRPGPDMRKEVERCLARVSAVIILFLFYVLFTNDRCNDFYACTIDSNL